MIDTDLASRLAAVQSRIAAAARRAGRAPEGVTLLGVSKTRPLAAIQAAYELGLRHFGENRVQEAADKFATYHPADLTLHLIGHLQSNKAKPAATLFAVVHSLDSRRLAEALAARCAERPTPLDVLVQVNVAGEASKEGVAPAEALPLLRAALALPGLRPVGLMTIAPLVVDPEAVRPVFRRLRQLRDECAATLGVPLPELSMGMTGDFEVAVEEGATLVRVGRAIFGEREQVHPA
ncbi:MAG: YggS family pyridoxal phosphate-dependent enzyme [Chloroflexota bacterium]